MKLSCRYMYIHVIEHAKGSRHLEFFLELLVEINNLTNECEVVTDDLESLFIYFILLSICIIFVLFLNRCSVIFIMCAAKIKEVT
jgi:hypothetical protein